MRVAFYAAPFVILAGFFVVYIQTSSFIKNKISSKISRWQTAGYEVFYDKMELSVFSPFAGLKIKNFSIKSPIIAGDWEFFSDDITIKPYIFSKNKIKLSFQSKQRIRFKENVYNIKTKNIDLLLERKKKFYLSFLELRIEKAIFNKKNKVDFLRLNIRKLKPQESDLYSPAFLINLRAKNLSTIIKNYGLLPKNIKKLAFDSTVTGRFPVNNFLSAIDTWRIEGGAIEVHKLNFDWDNYKTKIKGTLAFDNNYMPMASLILETNNIIRFLGLLKQEKIISSGAFSMAKIALAQQIGANNKILAPLSIFNNSIYIENVKLGEFIPPNL